MQLAKDGDHPVAEGSTLLDVSLRSLEATVGSQESPIISLDPTPPPSGEVSDSMRWSKSNMQPHTAIRPNPSHLSMSLPARSSLPPLELNPLQLSGSASIFHRHFIRLYDLSVLPQVTPSH